MSIAIPNVRVCNPSCHEGLSVFPLFAETGRGVEYILADEALGNESTVVEEISDAGSVSELLVHNKSDAKVLFIEGEELIGAKQSRWHYRKRSFTSSGSHSPHELRCELKKSVFASLESGRGHRSDQRKVWDRLLSGFMMDALEEGVAKGRDAGADDVNRLPGRVSDAKCKKVGPVGEGEGKVGWRSPGSYSINTVVSYRSFPGAHRYLVRLFSSRLVPQGFSYEHDAGQPLFLLPIELVSCELLLIDCRFSLSGNLRRCLASIVCSLS